MHDSEKDKEDDVDKVVKIIDDLSWKDLSYQPICLQDLIRRNFAQKDNNTVGLATMFEQCFGITLDKTLTCSDWSNLTEKHYHYAGGDVLAPLLIFKHLTTSEIKKEIQFELDENKVVSTVISEETVNNSQPADDEVIENQVDPIEDSFVENQSSIIQINYPEVNNDDFKKSLE